MPSHVVADLAAHLVGVYLTQDNHHPPNHLQVSYEKLLQSVIDEKAAADGENEKLKAEKASLEAFMQTNQQELTKKENRLKEAKEGYLATSAISNQTIEGLVPMLEVMFGAFLLPYLLGCQFILGPVHLGAELNVLTCQV